MDGPFAASSKKQNKETVNTTMAKAVIFAVNFAHKSINTAFEEAIILMRQEYCKIDVGLLGRKRRETIYFNEVIVLLFFQKKLHDVHQ